MYVGILTTCTSKVYSQNTIDLDQKLLKAIFSLNEDSIDSALRKGADINFQDSTGNTGLHYMCKSNNIRIVKHLLAKGANADIRNSIGNTPLHEIVSRLDYTGIDITRLVIPYTNVNIQNNHGETPLHIAAHNKKTDIIKILLENGANPAIQSNTGIEFIDIIVDNDDVQSFAVYFYYLNKDIPTRLMSKIKFLQPKNYFEFSYFPGMGLKLTKIGEFIFAQKEDDSNKQQQRNELVYKYLNDLDSTFNPDFEQAIWNNLMPLYEAGIGTDETAAILICAVEKKQLKIVENLVEKGVKLNISNIQRKSNIIDKGYSGIFSSYKKPLLSIAIDNNDIPMVKFLIKQNYVNINEVDYDGFTPLMIAVSDFHYEICKFLIDNRANLKIKNWKNKTAYDIAIDNGNKEIINLFKTKNRKTKQPVSTLINMSQLYFYENFDSILATYDNKTLSRIRLEGMPSEFQKYNIRYTPLNFLAYFNDCTKGKALLEKGMDPNVTDENCPNGLSSPLHNAVSRNNIDFIQLLFMYNANPNIQNGQGCTPLMIASSEGYLDVCKILCDFGADRQQRDNSGKTAYDYYLEGEDNNQCLNIYLGQLLTEGTFPAKKYYFNDLFRLAKKFDASEIPDSALFYTEKALAQSKEEIDTASVCFGNILDELAGLYRNNGNLSMAIDLYRQAISLTNRQTVRESLAECYREAGDRENELAIYRDILINDEIWGLKNSASNNDISDKYIRTAFDIGQYTGDVGDRLISKIEYIKQETKNKIGISNNSELDDFIKSQEGYFDNFKKFALCNSDSTYKNHLYNNELFLKGIALQSFQFLKKAILETSDKDILSLGSDYILKKEKLAREPLNITNEEINEIERLEKLLTLKLPDISKYIPNFLITVDSIKKRLNPDEVAIEFIYFKDDKSGFTNYYALLLKEDSNYPELVPLFEEKQLDDLFSETGYRYGIYDRGVSGRTAVKNIDYGIELYNLVWRPLEPYLKNGIKIINYVPAGRLHEIAFSAIPPDSDSVLSDKYDLYQLTSTRQIISKEDDSEQIIKKAVLFGGIAYGESDDAEAWQPLKWSLPEIDSIDRTLKNQGTETEKYSGIHATEGIMKALSGMKNDLILISTHGFYLSNSKVEKDNFRYLNFSDKNKAILLKNSLLRSGLIFANGNQMWVTGEKSPDDREDGILTSEEISGLNLFGTKLVILSACETGLGDINGYEGVFGLQRAFKMAGVQTILMSLWDVSDNATSELMQRFFEYRQIDKLEKHEAFKKAQNQIRKIYPSTKDWAGFVMVD